MRGMKVSGPATEGNQGLENQLQEIVVLFMCVYSAYSFYS